VTDWRRHQLPGHSGAVAGTLARTWLLSRISNGTVLIYRPTKPRAINRQAGPAV